MVLGSKFPRGCLSRKLALSLEQSGYPGTNSHMMGKDKCLLR